VLGHPLTYTDVVEFTSFRSMLIEELLKLGFTINRAESFAVCLREIRDAFASELKPERSFKPKRSNFAKFVTDYSNAQTMDVLFPDDEVCSGDLDLIRSKRSHQTGPNEHEQTNPTPSTPGG